jgi:hypothetical protein
MCVCPAMKRKNGGFSRVESSRQEDQVKQGAFQCDSLALQVYTHLEA